MHGTSATSTVLGSCRKDASYNLLLSLTLVLFPVDVTDMTVG
jgi:predicted metal-dependent hydrolase